MEDTDFLRCLRYALRGETLPSGTALDWKSVWERAKSHEVVPFLYPFVKSQKPFAAPPQEMLKTWRRYYLRSASANVSIYHQIEEALKALHKSSIPFVVLKGACLAQLVYQDIALRPMGDIDLLVKPEDMGRTKEALMCLGYVSAGSDPHHQVFVRGREARPVEIHRSLVDETIFSNVDHSMLWNRIRPVEIGGSEAHILSPEDLLMHLCLHCMANMFNSTFRSLCDMDKVITINNPSFDWSYFSAQTKLWGLQKGIFLILQALSDFLATPVPEEVLRSLKPHDPTDAILRCFKDRILFKRAEQPNVSFQYTRLRNTESIKDKISLILGRIFLPPETIRTMYGLPRGPLPLGLGYCFRTRHLFKHHTRRGLMEIKRSILSRRIPSTNKEVDILLWALSE
jgi:hypothetical protein